MGWNEMKRTLTYLALIGAHWGRRLDDRSGAGESPGEIVRAWAMMQTCSAKRSSRSSAVHMRVRLWCTCIQRLMSHCCQASGRDEPSEIRRRDLLRHCCSTAPGKNKVRTHRSALHTARRQASRPV